MLRLPTFIALTAPLVFVAVACTSDDGGGAGTGTSPTEAATQAATPVDAAQAVAPPDQAAYRASIAGQRTVQETCAYSPDDALADCSERGIYKLDPPPEYADPSCVVGLSGGGVKPEYVLCTKPPRGESTYFVIQP